MESRRLTGFDTLKPLPEELVETILAQGIKTGSRAFGVSTPESDLDIIIKKTSAISFSYLTVNQWAVYNGDYRQEGFQSVYVKFKTRECPVNLLIFDDNYEYSIWEDSTALMVDLSRSNAKLRGFLSDKLTRVVHLSNLRNISEIKYHSK